MDDTARNSNVTDIRLPIGQNSQQDDQNQQVPKVRVPVGGGFGRPGLVGGGEGVYSGDSGEGGDSREKEKPQEPDDDSEVLKLLEKARRRETKELAELHKTSERQKAAEVQGVAETQKGVETLQSIEASRGPEVQGSPEAQKIRDGRVQKKETDRQFAGAPRTSALGKIVDKRTGKEKMHRVDINRADSITKIADIKEQDFIERVEQEHVKSII